MILELKKGCILWQAALAVLETQLYIKCFRVRVIHTTAPSGPVVWI